MGLIELAKPSKGGRLHQRSIREREVDAELCRIFDHRGGNPERLRVLGCEIQRTRECSPERAPHERILNRRKQLLDTPRFREATNGTEPDAQNDRLLRGSHGLSEVEIASCRDGELLKQIAGDVLQLKRGRRRQPPPHCKPALMIARADGLRTLVQGKGIVFSLADVCGTPPDQKRAVPDVVWDTRLDGRRDQRAPAPSGAARGGARSLPGRRGRRASRPQGVRPDSPTSRASEDGRCSGARPSCR